MNIDSKLNKDIDEYLYIVGPDFVEMDFQTFSASSISWDSYDPLIAEPWVKRTLKMISDCSDAGLTPQDIGPLFPGMGEVRGNLLFDLWISNYTDTSVEDRLMIFGFYSDILQAMCIEDPYASEINVVHTQDEIKTLTKSLQKGSHEDARKLGRLINACYHVGYALYSDMHPSIAYENYGPYDVSSDFGNGAILAVKHYPNLKAPELYMISKSLPYNHLDILSVYHNVEMTVDSITHVNYKGSVINNLHSYSLTVNGIDTEIEEADKISTELENMSAKVFKEFRTLDPEAKKEKYWNQKLYSFKDIYKTLGQNWEPSKDIIKAGKGKALHKPVYPKNKKELIAELRKVLDPRILYKV